MWCCNDVHAVMTYGTSAYYKAAPSPEQRATGVVPLDSLPAAWWNCMWCDTNSAINEARDAIGSFIDEVNTLLANADIQPNCNCVDTIYRAINKIRQTLGNATTAGAVKSSSQPSEVAIDQTTGMMSVNCLGNAASLTTSARTVVGAVNELKSTYDQCFTDTGTALSGKAPTSHVSDLTTYGVGNADCYGHLKISDTYTCDLGCTGMAASQTALYCVYDFAAGIAAGVASLGNTAGCALGTASAGTAVTAARSDHVHPTTGLATVQCANGYWGLGYAGTYNDYLRTPAQGLIPYANNPNGCGYIGTEYWPFLAMYAKTFYGKATCAQCVYHDTYTGSADRPIMVTSDNDYSAPGYYNQGTVRSGCNFTYNPATGQLKLKSNGKTACISHMNASYLHIYTDAACVAFNADIYLPSGKYIDRARCACCADTHMGFMYPYVNYCTGTRHGVCFTVCSGQTLTVCNVSATLRGIWWKIRPNSSNYNCCFAWLPPGCCMGLGQCWGWSPACNCYAIYTFGAFAMV